MTNRYLALVGGVLGVALIAGGCDSTSRNPAPVANSPTQNTPTARYQLLHASPDAPAVNVIGLPGTQITGADYKDGTVAQTITAGSYDVTVEGILPDGSTTAVIGPATIPFEQDVLTTIIAVGDDLAITPFIFNQPDTAVPAGNTRLSVIHGAPNAPEVSVFLTAPDADLAGEMPVVTFGFGDEAAGPVEVPSGGPYQVRVTLPFAAPDAPAVVFDSGELSLPDGANLVITAVENTNSADGIEDDSPISLVILDGSGATELQDTNAAAELRVVHASADTPAVDVIVNDDLANPLVDALTYPDFVPDTGFVEVPAGTYDISVVDDATQTAEPINIDGVALDAGVAYDVIAVNEFANVAAYVATDDFRRLETAAKVRLIHASTVADAASPAGVDIFVTDEMTAMDLSTTSPAIENFTYDQRNTGFIELSPGEYVVSVTADGSFTPLIQTPLLALEANGIYTAIARDPDPAVANDTPGLILLDDFN